MPLQVDNHIALWYNPGMELKEEILTRLYGGEASGEKLAAELGVTRASVWKAVNALKRDGFDIAASTNKGYRLRPSDVMCAAGVRHFLTEGWEVEVLRSAPSTNDIAKARAAAGADRYAVIADAQTAGRGRLRRAFFSPGGAGVYLSAVVRPALRADECGRITAYAALAAARAVESLTGADVKIKWVNDLYLGGRKICGILTEGGVSMEGGTLEYAVVGIGINVRRAVFPTAVADVATSIEAETGVAADRCELAARVLDELAGLEEGIKSPGFAEEYRRRSCVIGRIVTVNGEFDALVTGIDDDCALLLERGGERMKYSAGEVSLKLS